MAGKSGRKVRIKSGATAIAGALTDSISINRELIDATDKDDAGIVTYLNELGTFAMEMSCEGNLKDDTLHALARNNSDVLHTLTFDIAGIGSYSGEFGITKFEVSGEDGAEMAKFAATFVASGAVTWTAAT